MLLNRLIMAVVVAIVVTIGLELLASIFVAVASVEIALTVGHWLQKYDTLIGILFGLAYFAKGYTWPFSRP